MRQHGGGGCRLTFPDEEMLGVDIVIPDISYLLENKRQVRGIFLTHGHEDHIGALPFILRAGCTGIRHQAYLGFIEHKLRDQICLIELSSSKSGPGMNQYESFEIEFIRVSHSIPGVVALVTTSLEP